MNWIAQAAVAAQKKCKAEALQLNASDPCSVTGGGDFLAPGSHPPKTLTA
jgi:hypothetical protein